MRGNEFTGIDHTGMHNQYVFVGRYVKFHTEKRLKKEIGYERSSDEVVTSSPLNRKVGCSKPTMIRFCRLMMTQQCPVRKNYHKLQVTLRHGKTASLSDELNSLYVSPFPWG